MIFQAESLILLKRSKSGCQRFSNLGVKDFSLDAVSNF